MFFICNFAYRFNVMLYLHTSLSVKFCVLECYCSLRMGNILNVKQKYHDYNNYLIAHKFKCCFGLEKHSKRHTIYNTSLLIAYDVKSNGLLA